MNAFIARLTLRVNNIEYFHPLLSIFVKLLKMRGLANQMCKVCTGNIAENQMSGFYSSFLIQTDGCAFLFTITLNAADQMK
jgi:hypothetical protein